MKQEVVIFSILLLGLFAGAATSYSHLSPLLLCLLAFMLHLLKNLPKVRSEALAVFIFAMGFLAGGMFWIGLGIYHPPVNSLKVAIAFSALLLIFHAALYGIVFFVVRQLAAMSFAVRGRAALAGCVALSWMITEVLRSVGIWAMPWGLLGYSQLDNPLLKGLYPLIGSHGTAGAAWLAAALLLAMYQALARRYRLHEAIPLSMLAAAPLVLVASTASAWLEWTQPSGRTLTVRLVHTDLPGEEKHAPQAQLDALGQLQRLAGAGQADLTVFPELFLLQTAAALPHALRSDIVAAVRSTHAALVFGSPAGAVAGSEAQGAQNTLVQLDENGDTHVYAKEILLPFSEYLPDHPLLQLAYRYLYHYPQANFAAGPADQPSFVIKGIPAGLSICSELAYAGKASRQARGAGFLINASSDAWIPSMAYMRQAHLIARVRAAEAQKPMVRANNVGYSAFIDHHGQVLSSLGGAAGVGVMDVAPRTGDTPYVRMAAWLADRFR
ncbi:MAG: apolipoprotein N-acyltransferase [Polaromonas sp.]|nr:apolipoprotein N-acyltransferase [Polaromonas sp.]